MLVVAVVVVGLILGSYLRMRMAIAAAEPTPGERPPASAAAVWAWVIAALAVLACFACVLAR